MNNFYEWLYEFADGKTEVPTPETSDLFSVHSKRRFIEDKKIWEIAFTYTGRLVVRFGQVDSEGVNIEWNDWETQHDIEVPDEFKL
ncbi:MAG: hypothetical protein ACXVAX_04560 [Pseudobdellovibrio sp.]